jgi:L-rhamnose-H+ transport protein
VVLLGGFTSNFIWCVILNVKNRTGYQYFSPALRNGAPGLPVPMLNNYLFSALAGVVWYLQFFFYSMGETQMGDYKFSSWTLHMASIIIFSSLWGIALHEWKGSSSRTKTTLAIGLATLVLSTIVVGYGNFLGVIPVP